VCRKRGCEASIAGVVLSKLQHLHDDDERFRELSPLAEDLPLPINHRHNCAQHPINPLLRRIQYQIFTA
jgi:hypothetical protein